MSTRMPNTLKNKNIANQMISRHFKDKSVNALPEDESKIDKLNSFPIPFGYVLSSISCFSPYFI